MSDKSVLKQHTQKFKNTLNANFTNISLVGGKTGGFVEFLL